MRGQALVWNSRLEQEEFFKKKKKKRDTQRLSGEFSHDNHTHLPQLSLSSLHSFSRGPTSTASTATGPLSPTPAVEGAQLHPQTQRCTTLPATPTWPPLWLQWLQRLPAHTRNLREGVPKPLAQRQSHSIHGG